jgi:hypothetical protein
MLRTAQRARSLAPSVREDPEFVRSLLSMMRVFHYVVGITAPDKKHEKQTLLVWIGLLFGLTSLGFFFAWFISTQLFR